jgi:exonuclease SbcD
MKFAHIADLHVSDKSSQTMNLKEQQELLEWIGNDARARGAHAVLVAGDIYSGPSTIAERDAVCSVIQSWAMLMDVVMVRGNHDIPGDLDIMSRLNVKRSVFVIESPCIHQLDIAIRIGCLPWPLAAPDPITLRQILSGFAAQDIDILLAHVDLFGATADSGKILDTYNGAGLTAIDLQTSNARYYALGHIHTSQDVGLPGGYAGSPRPTAFGGPNNHGYILVDSGAGYGPPTWEFIPTPCRPMLTIDYDKNEQVGSLVFHDSACRIKYTATQDNREKLRQLAEQDKQDLLATGAHGVVIDERMRLEHKVRSEEIKKANTVTDQIEATWAETQRPQRASDILAKLHAIEKEINHEA